jgi:hypothetical protein
MNPIGSASAGVISAAARFDQAGVNVVKAASSGSPDDLASAVVDQATAKAQFDGSLKVMQVQDQMAKATLNILV